MSTRAPRRRPRTRILLSAAAAVVLAAGCADVPDPSEDTIALPDTEVPTTALRVDYLDVIGYSYCEVVDEVVADIRAYVDPASDFGDPGGLQQTYVGALRAFDALAQIAPGEVRTDAERMRRTLLAAVQTAQKVGWDIAEVQAGSGGRSDANAAAQSLAALRRYTNERCGVDIVDTDLIPTTVAGETPEQRLQRILLELFPDLDDEKVRCLAPRLPLDMDPQSAYFDENQLLSAFRGCRIDIEDPSAPTSIAPAPFDGPRPTTPSTTMPVDSTPEYGGPDSES